ncbi:MAG: hypothetical protein ABI594_20410 [Ginsengibacter sp.]
MNERLPYEEELSRQLNDLPLPDENVSWEDMKQKLERDDDDGGIVPPLLKGCFGYGALIMLLAIILFFIIRPDKLVFNKKEKDIVSSKEINVGSHQNIPDKIDAKDSLMKQASTGSIIVGKNDSTNHQIEKRVYGDSLITTNKKDLDKIRWVKKKSVTTESAIQNPQNINRRRRVNKKFNQKNVLKTKDYTSSEASTNEQKTNSSSANRNVSAETITPQDKANVSAIDSTIKKSNDSTIAAKEFKEPENNYKKPKKDSSSKRSIYFGGGIALHQLVPVNGQKFVPYNSLGRKGTLADYIPSIYFRIYKDQKWCVQTELRYGAPQYNKEVLYFQQKIVDSFNINTKTTSNRLKKTYYHQLPVSFNYFVLPHFSTGLGFTWNKFTSAVIEQEIKEANNITQVDTLQMKKIFNTTKPDSNFVSSYFQAIIEMQYQLKHFSFGARYSFGLEPYIKFQLPGGQKQEEKNSSLQIFIRYNLWESKKK